MFDGSGVVRSTGPKADHVVPELVGSCGCMLPMRSPVPPILTSCLPSCVTCGAAWLDGPPSSPSRAATGAGAPSSEVRAGGMISSRLFAADLAALQELRVLAAVVCWPSLLFGSLLPDCWWGAESEGPCSCDLLVRSFSGPLHWGVPPLLYRLQGLTVSTGL